AVLASLSRPSVDRLSITVVLAILLSVPPSAYAARHRGPHSGMVRSGAVGASGPTVRLAGQVAPIPREAVRLAGDASRDDDPVTLTFVLARTDQAAFERHLAALYDPASPSFREFLGQR